jgi:opacity protein-like surface antigen
MRKISMAALTLAFLATLAHAEDYLSPTEERLRLSLGVIYTSNQTSLQIDSSGGVAGTPINAENQFGLDKWDFEPKFQAMVRVEERHRLRFDFFEVNRTGSTTITQPIIFRNVVLQPGDPLNSNFSISTLSLTYEYSILHGEKYEVAATLGVTETDISARARVATQTRHIDQREDQAGPFATAGLDATYVISKRFYLDGRAEYMHISINELSGSLGYGEFDALYRLRPNIAFALGYNYVRAKLESTQIKQSGYFNLTSKGPELFVRVAF